MRDPPAERHSSPFSAGTAVARSPHVVVKRVAVVLAAVLLTSAVTLPLWKPAMKRFRWFVVATNIYQDALRRSGLNRAQIGQPDFAAIPDSEVSGYLDRINATFRAYQTYGDMTRDRIRGTDVLEIGPGETLGVAIRFLAAGADRVTAIDKFVPLLTSPFHQRLYRRLVDGLPAEERRNLDDAVDLSEGVSFDPKRLQYVYGQGVEEAGRTFAPESYNVIVSNAVLEEVYDLDALFTVLDRLLAPGGRQVHVIDLRDYGMFSKFGFHQLEFLTLSDGVYRYMTESTGQPNRHLLNYYRDKMTALGYRATIYRTWVLGDNRGLAPYPTELRQGRDYTDANLALLSTIRPRLLPRYRSLPDEDLLTQGILLVADKPHRQGLGARD